MIARLLVPHFEVTILTTGRRRSTVEHDGVRYRTLALTWAGPRAGQLLYHAWLPFAARLMSHDLWIESFTPPFSTSFLPLFARKRVVGLAQSLSGEEMSARYGLPFYMIERFGLRFYRDIIVLNDADGERVRQHSLAAVQVIPNGVERTQLDERQLGRGEHILFLGRIDMWEKGLDLLCAAYRKSRPELPLLVAEPARSVMSRSWRPWWQPAAVTSAGPVMSRASASRNCCSVARSWCCPRGRKLSACPRWRACPAASR